jgi:putative transposase
MILDSSVIKDLFLVVVQRARKKYRFRIEHFCIMGNHFHLMIRPLKGESLSKIMQWILSVFAMAWNRVHGLTGHVWGQRFHSSIIGSFKSFLRVFQYFDQNPVSAHLVSVARDWNYSGLWHARAGIRCIIGKPGLHIQVQNPAHAQLLLSGTQDS